jgi:hypothetical protein
VFASDAALLNASKYLGHHGSLWKETIRTVRPESPSSTPAVHFGTILSGSKIIADKTVRDALRSTWTQAIGLEMEGGGAAAAAHEHPSRPSLILVKGVCDLATARKNDKWQAYAADAAGRYAISLLIHQGSIAHERPTRQDYQGSSSDFDTLGIEPMQLRLMLTDAYNLNGLKNISHDLRVEWEEFPDRSTLSGAARDLIDTMRRQRRLKDLLGYLRSNNPNLFDAGPSE